MGVAPVNAMAGRHPERAGEHVPECDSLAQSEELVVDWEGRVFDRRACLDGLTSPAVCLPVRDVESGCVRKYALQRSENRRSVAGVLTGRQGSPQGRSAFATFKFQLP